MAGVIKLLSTLILVAAVVLAAVAQRGEAEITCGTVVTRLTPCLPYVTGKGPLGECCDGMKTLNKDAKTKADRQSICGCLKSMAAAYPGVDYGKAAELPKECGVDVPYVISPDVDCSKVK